MTTLAFELSGQSCRYVLRQGLLSDADAMLGPLAQGRRMFLVTDGNVAPLWAQPLADRLGAPLLVLPAGEEHKQWPTVERIVRWLLAAGVERSDLIVAVGGGVVSDLVGFAAAIALRGIAWVAVPTTLLAMVDAAVGGKTGIDLPEGKNLIGAFWPPRLVLADPATLATLDRRQLRAGLAEVIKVAMIAPSEMVRPLDRKLNQLAFGELHAAEPVIAGAVRTKADIVELDEREHGPRAALNLGHTLGHALEAATGYNRFLHGEAVAWGLLAALLLGRGRGMLATDHAESWATRIETLAPLPPLDDIEWDELLPFLGHDKKRREGRVRWVLPDREGVEIGVELSEADVLEAFLRLKRIDPGGPFTPLP